MSTAMSHPNVSLLDVSSYLPGDPIPAEYYAQFADSDELRDNLMFRAPSSATTSLPTRPRPT